MAGNRLTTKLTNDRQKQITDATGKGVTELSVELASTGEQLRLDYHFSAAPTVQCRCGSPKCRGTINALRGGRGKPRTLRRLATRNLQVL